MARVTGRGLSTLAVVFVVGLMSAGVTAGAVAAERLFADTRQGCQVWDLYPDARKTVAWEGPCKDGYADGVGVLSWYSGARLEGRQTATFVAGRAQGAGEILWENGRRFTGTFKDGLADGPGRFVWTDGRRYDGDWKADHRTGSGTLTLPNGDRYVGRFERNRPTGDGAYLSAADGKRYAPLVDKDWRITAGAPLDGAAVLAPVSQPPVPAPPSAALAVSKPLAAPPAPIQRPTALAPVPAPVPVVAPPSAPPVAPSATLAASPTAVPVSASVDPRTLPPPLPEPVLEPVGKPLSLKP